MDVYFSTIEYTYSRKAASYGKYKGGSVYAFVRARDARDALEKFEKRIKALNLEIDRVDFIAMYEGTPWETKEDQEKFDNLAKEASQADDVICDDFYSYKEDK
ncbi:MAG: hypothetical protein D3926_09590 [Desulfobacteraceae bacterium]|nr:MAG: hypothetical protein D3926_09590 [Desulfobacteraceae bacterium]